MSLPRMIVRPLNAAKPAITSSMLALSHWTVIRAAWDCAASAWCAARYSSIDIGRPSDGVVTRAALSGPPVTGGAGASLLAVRSAVRRGAAATAVGGATVLLDHAANPVRSVP